MAGPRSSGCAAAALSIDDSTWATRRVRSAWCRARHAGRRHLAGAHLAGHLLPGFRGRRDVRQLGAIERQVAGLEPLVVAGDAVPASPAPRAEPWTPARRLAATRPAGPARGGTSGGRAGGPARLLGREEARMACHGGHGGAPHPDEREDTTPHAGSRSLGHTIPDRGGGTRYAPRARKKPTIILQIPGPSGGPFFGFFGCVCPEFDWGENSANQRPASAAAFRGQGAH